MNNFEQRLLLSYLSKLINVIDLRSYAFDDLFDFFLKSFKIKKKYFKFDEDGCILVETLKQQTELKKRLRVILKVLQEKLAVESTSFEDRLLIIKNLYGLKEDEYQAFIYILMQDVNRVFNLLDDAIDGISFDKFARYYLGLRFGQKERIVNNLFLNKLLGNKSSHPTVNSELLKVFDDAKYDTVEKITAMLLGKPEKSTLTLKDFSHIKEEQEKVVSILKAAIETKATGVNILLHGNIGSGKTEFSKLICNTIKVPIYAVKTENCNGEEAKRCDRLADLYSKQHILKRTGNGCILFDEAEDVFNRGFGDSGTASKGYLNRLLETSPVPVIWTTNNISDVDSAFLRRMTYCIEFEKLSESVRLNIWKKTLRKNKLKVPIAKLEELNSSYDIPPSLIANAVKTTKMIGGNADDFEGLIENVAKVVAKKKVVKEQKDKTTEDYNINLVNADIDLKDLTDKIKKSGKLNFSLCLYGAPGSSKSSFARYLASELGLEVVQKRASDLLDMYVGNSEKNIAAAFAECRAKKCMLIIDEADSLLQDRNNAHASWEISQINEMLTQMESFEYPFVATTNIMDSLDEACLRRFTFKVRHNFMTPEQVELAIKYFFKDIKHDGKVTDIKGLTAGDFVTVKRKADFLCVDNLDEIRRMLTEEVKLKKCSDLKNTIGFTL